MFEPKSVEVICVRRSRSAKHLMGNRSQLGYTLVELLVVTAVVSLLLVSSLVAVNNSLPRWRADEAARDVAVALRAARADAVINRRVTSVPLDTARDMYALLSTTASGGVVTEGGVRLASLPVGVTYARPTAGDVVTLSPPGAPGDEAAVFDSSGRLLSNVRPGEVYLGLPERDIYRRVMVSFAGTVSVERWNGSTWE